jgi:tripeptidyl-peptidase-1
VSDPDSPEYGQYMTLAEVDALTAPSTEATEAVRSWLSSVGAVCQNKTSDVMKCKASVAAVEKALDARVYNHSHSRTGATVARIVGSATIPQAVAPHVRVISGLRDLPVPNTADMEAMYGKRVGVQKVGAPQGSSLSVVPSTLTTLYDVGTNTGSSSVTLGIAEYQDLTAFAPSDLATFITQTGVPNFTFAKRYGPFNSNPPQAESTLDVQYGGSMAPDASHIYYIDV